MNDGGIRALTRPFPGRSPRRDAGSEVCLYRLIADSSANWEWLEDSGGRMLWVSPSCEPITGHSADEFLKDSGLLLAIVHPEDRPHFESHRSECRLSDERDQAEYRIVRPDGAIRWVAHQCRPLSLADGESVGRRASNHDVTRRKKIEEEVLKLNRTLRALSNSNQALVRARVESDLLEDVCRVIVEDCGHAMVWIGYAEEDEGKSVRPVARAGFDQGYLDALNVTWADTERGRGPTGTAIRTAQPASCRNMRTDPRFTLWREEALKRGYAASLALPLIADGRAFGAITIYSSGPDPFSDDEVKLLTELAGDLSFGIASIRALEAQAAAEQAVRASEQRYRSLFESMDEGFAACEMIYDEAGEPSDFRYLSVNPAFARLTGLPVERVVGGTVKELIPGLEPFWIEAYGRVVKSGQSEKLDSPVAELGKHYEVFAWRSGVDRFAVVFTDTTERKKVEAKLKWLASFPGRNPLPVVEADPDGHVHYANPAATSLFPDLEDPRLPHPWLTNWETAVKRLRDGGTGTFSREVTVGDRDYEQTLYLVTEADRIRVYGTEITELRRAAEALEVANREAVDERNRLKAVLEALPVGMAITDAQGGNTHSNKAFDEIWGGPRPPTQSVDDYVAYKAWWAETDEPVGPEEWASAIAVREGRAVVGQRLQIERFDGRRAYVLNSAAPVVGSDGRVAGSAVALVDVTEAREAEEQLRELNETLEKRVAERSAEAERRAVQLKAFASELSQAERRERLRLASALHDQLQQILVAAKLNLVSLQGRFGDETLRSDALRVEQLLDESIAWCRSVTVTLSPPVLQEAGLAGGLGWLARQMQEQHGLQVSVSVGKDWVEPADADLRAFLFEAVRELLLNVAKHSGQQIAQVVVRREVGNIEIRVEDDGKGLDQKALRNYVQEGARFGLFSIKQRLEMMGGSMSVESGPGHGTRVTLRAVGGPEPAKVEAVAEPVAGVVRSERPRPVGARPGRVRVVIADDHRIFRQGLVALLRAEGNIDVVGEAADGAEAVDMARALRPDVVIMDVSMPKMNGIEATRQITAELPGLRVIGLSMHEDETIAASMREAGAVDFVTKGGPSDTLISAVLSAYSHGEDP